MSNYIINPKDQNISIQTIIDRIHNGFEIQKSQSDKLDEQKIVDYNDAIIIAPDYQREYRSNEEDESSLVESVLLGIPIPPIFLANEKLKGVQVLNVVDGQHRLRAFFRFVGNKFKLKKLSILKEFDDKYFRDLSLDDRVKILSKELSATVFKDFPGKEFELEIFNRYNKGTKPLSQQEIRNAVYNSKFNIMVNEFSKKLFLNKKDKLSISYNVSKDRIQKKRLQESIFVIISILERGINENIQKSPQYTEEFMKEKSKLEKDSPLDFEKNYNEVMEIFNKFNDFITIINNKIEYPFSKELYGIANRNYKFQISLAMVLSGIFRNIYLLDKNFTNKLKDQQLDNFLVKIKKLLNDSFLADPDYSASSTNPAELIKLVNKFDFKIENN